jgi:hypothetical protein
MIPYSITDYLNKNNQPFKTFAWFPTIVRIVSNEHGYSGKMIIWFEHYWIRKVYDQDRNKTFKTRYIKEL